MASVEERLNKLREERIAREKSRIDKLREINLKKYNKDEPQSTPKPSSNISTSNKTLKSDCKPKFDVIKSNIAKCSSKPVKNNIHVNGSSKRLMSAPLASKNQPDNKGNTKTFPNNKPVLTNHKITSDKNEDLKLNMRKTILPDGKEKKDFVNSNKVILKPDAKIPVNFNKSEPKVVRKSLAPVKHSMQNKLTEKPKVPEITRKSIVPSKVRDDKNWESVFDRLYKPKTVQKKEISAADRLQKDPSFLKKVMHQGGLIANKRHTVFEPKLPKTAPVRRSISAVHFKRISKKELGNCFQKWSSIGEKLNEVHLADINEDDSVKQDVVTSAVKSERRKVHLQTPGRHFNTPTPQELQTRLINWLKSRGKSIDSYEHLQCFGIHHLPKKRFEPLHLPPEPADYDDEDKENIALEHDSDNESFTYNMNDRKNDFKNERNKWRSPVSRNSDSLCLNKSFDTTLNSDELPVDDLLLGALNDLTELLREGFDWEQCARWLRALRERFPHAPALAAYWECRAALEETRGDLPASVQCWEEAIAKGTQHSIVDANLDQLLGKFMQLNISPNGGRRARADPKLVDVKNVFKSTIIRFAVQQAKLRQSSHEKPTYVMTPVRRSSRLSVHWSNKKTPLLCSSVKEANLEGKQVHFVRNTKLCETP